MAIHWTVTHEILNTPTYHNRNDDWDSRWNFRTIVLCGFVFLIILLPSIWKILHYMRDSKSQIQLAEGIRITEKTKRFIRNRFVSIYLNEKGGIHYYNTRNTRRIFSIKPSPELIFKMLVPDIRRHEDISMKSRYQRIIDGQSVCRINNLNLLVIPHVKLFILEVNERKHQILAEKKLNIQNSTEQEYIYEKYAKILNEAIRQLTVFICKTGFSDVTWNNIPVLMDRKDEHGNVSIGLIDIEERDGAQMGLFGDSFFTRGLVKCVNEEQGLIVLTEAKKWLWNTSGFNEAYQLRKAEIREKTLHS